MECSGLRTDFELDEMIGETHTSTRTRTLTHTPCLSAVIITVMKNPLLICSNTPLRSLTLVIHLGSQL